MLRKTENKSPSTEEVSKIETGKEKNGPVKLLNPVRPFAGENNNKWVFVSVEFQGNNWTDEHQISLQQLCPEYDGKKISWVLIEGQFTGPDNVTTAILKGLLKERRLNFLSAVEISYGLAIINCEIINGEWSPMDTEKLHTAYPRYRLSKINWNEPSLSSTEDNNGTTRNLYLITGTLE